MELHPEPVLLTTFQADAIHLDDSYSLFIPARCRFLFPLWVEKTIKARRQKAETKILLSVSQVLLTSEARWTQRTLLLANILQFALRVAFLALLLSPLSEGWIRLCRLS